MKKKTARKIIGALLVLSLVALTSAGCAQTRAAQGFDANREIHVLTREDGSGTRSAFIELLGIEQKNEDGTRKDLTTKEAAIAKQTDVMMTNVANNVAAIGYISLGSLNDTVRALAVEGVAPSSETVKDGSYPIARPFLVATRGEPTGLSKDFLDFIASKEGQDVVSKSYIAADDAAPGYVSAKPSGKLVVAGSSSVTPIMEKLKEAYESLNPGVSVEIQMSDSSAGLAAARDGICDIAMSSRALKPTELETLTPRQIALDGIAVIVNNGNPTPGLTKAQIGRIYKGEILRWSEVQP